MDTMIERREGLATGEPQRILPVRLAMVEAAWLAEDVGTSHEQLTAIAAMRIEDFNPWDIGELATWWRRCQMATALPMPKTRIPSPRAAELRGDPATAATEWSRLGVPYEAALALMDIFGAPYAYYHSYDEVFGWYQAEGFGEVWPCNDGRRGFGVCGRDGAATVSRQSELSEQQSARVGPQSTNAQVMQRESA